jgi:hypothetical protein
VRGSGDVRMTSVGAYSVRGVGASGVRGVGSVAWGFCCARRNAASPGA